MYSIKTPNAPYKISCAIEDILGKNKDVVVVCVGSDLVMGDSLGPLLGTFLINLDIPAYVYGCLGQPVTAKEVAFIGKYIKKLHPNSIVLAIDAGIGDDFEVGYVKVLGHGLRPGLGVDKDLPSIGDCSIVGVVAGRSPGNNNLFNLTRLSFVYTMARVIADGIYKFFSEESGFIAPNVC